MKELNIVIDSLMTTTSKEHVLICISLLLKHKDSSVSVVSQK